MSRRSESERPAGGRVYGISVDGDRVTVVETHAGSAVSANTVAAGSLADSLKVALGALRRRRPDDRVRVTLIAPGVTMRRIDVTAKTASSRAEFDAAVSAALPVNPEANARAGAFYDPAALIGDAVTPGAAVIAPMPLVEEVYAILDRIPAEVVASPMTLTLADGVWVGLHYSVADVTLVVDGRPMAYRQLRAGGLSALTSVLGDRENPGLGQARLMGTVTGTGPDDAPARIELARYMRMVASELTQTLDYWRRTGEHVPTGSDVILYGTGAMSAVAHSSLAESGYLPGFPADLTQELSYVPLASRPEAVAAYAAASTAGLFEPQVSFLNPRLAEVIASRQRRRRRLVVAGAISAAVLVALAVVVRPLYQGWSAKRSADREHATVTAQFAERSGLYAESVDLALRQAVIDQEIATSPDWSQVYRTLFGTLPSGAVLGQVGATLREDFIEVNVSVEMLRGDYQDLTQWLERLASTPGVTSAWSSGFSVQDSAASFAVSLTMPRATATGTETGAPSTTPTSPSTTAPTSPSTAPAAPAPSSTAPAPPADTTTGEGR